MEHTVKPLISVLMPVYNCEEFVEEAVQSILRQTVQDFEFIIIDDASTDGTKKVVQSFGDSRIILISKEKNSGYTNSLNLGLRLAKGKYIARMDGDDISLPARFEEQLKFFEKHHDAIVCGTNYKFQNSNIVSGHPSDPLQLKVYLLSGCYIAHPTAMIKKNVLADNNISYDPRYEPAEDYNLWINLSPFGLLGNIEEPLLLYRTHGNQVSLLKSEKQQKYADNARLKMLGYLIPKLSQHEIALHLMLMRGWGSGKIKISEIKRWIMKLESINGTKGEFDQKYLSQFLADQLTQFIAHQKNTQISISKRINWKIRSIVKRSSQRVGLFKY